MPPGDAPLDPDRNPTDNISHDIRTSSSGNFALIEDDFEGRSRITDGASRRPLDLRAVNIGYGDPLNPSSPFWQNWETTFQTIAQEDYNALIWQGNNELWPPAGHRLLRLTETPEAREITSEQNEAIIAQAQVMFAAAKAAGLRNLLYSQVIWFTEAFAQAHGYTVSPPPGNVPYSANSYLSNYGGNHPNAKCGVRSDQTRAYVEAVFAEFPAVYQDLDGFYLVPGEPLPAERSTYFTEAILPGLQRSGREPLVILHQWQVPLDNYMENIVNNRSYDNLWLGFHALNAEQFTDAKAWPAAVEWAETTGLPTLPVVLPGNIQAFPFNSAQLASEVIGDLRRTVEFNGFFYWPHARYASSLFRRALGYYGRTGLPYSDDDWLPELEQRFVDAQAARHILNAYNISRRIIPEMCALVNQSSMGDRCLFLSYDLMADVRWIDRNSSPARGRRLLPVVFYAKRIAEQPFMRDYDGSEIRDISSTQMALWATSEGGTVYHILPWDHMAKVRRMGDDCFQEAEAALALVQGSVTEARRIHAWMEAYQLFARYYEKKVQAATMALVYSYKDRSEDRAEALQLADQTVTLYTAAINHLQTELVNNHGVSFANMIPGAATPNDLLQMEAQERQNIGTIFGWP